MNAKSHLRLKHLEIIICRHFRSPSRQQKRDTISLHHAPEDSPKKNSEKLENSPTATTTHSRNVYSELFANSALFIGWGERTVPTVRCSRAPIR